jgi:transposase
MLKRQRRRTRELFLAGSMKDLIPEDHILKKIDRILDLSWLRREVADLYDLTNGRPGIDPEAAVRLMLAGLSQGIVKDRKVMREAQVNLAIRWFVGYRLNEKLPDHSSLTRIRQRWGVERFAKIFSRSVQQCVEAGLVGGETIHVDATLIRADVSWESLVREHVSEVWQANQPEEPDDPGDGPARSVGRGRRRRWGRKMLDPVPPPTENIYSVA